MHYWNESYNKLVLLSLKVGPRIGIRKQGRYIIVQLVLFLIFNEKRFHIQYVKQDGVTSSQKESNSNLSFVRFAGSSLYD